MCCPSALFPKEQHTMNRFDREFLERVYSTPVETYIARLEAIGFEGMKRVLDAGCGFGQWTLALARLNDLVFAVDKDLERVAWLQEKLKEKKVNNVVAAAVSLEDFEPLDRYFDGVFCYGVLNCVPWMEVLKRFHRWLAPGGRLYATFNEIGWYLHLWKRAPHAVDGYDPQMIAAKTFFNTLCYRREGKTSLGDVVICLDEIGDFLDDIGMGDVVLSEEGGVNVTGAKTAPFFDGTYEGHPGVQEVWAVK